MTAKTKRKTKRRTTQPVKDKYECYHQLLTISKIKKNHYNVYLRESIGGDYYYHHLYQLLLDATKNFTIEVHVAGYGGEVYTGLNIINRFKATKAKVITHWSGCCFSMHSIIALSLGKPKTVACPMFLMLHDVEGGYGGKQNDVHLETTVLNQLIDDVYRIHGGWFLTEKEIVSLKDGRTLYIQNKDIQSRLKINTVK